MGCGLKVNCVYSAGNSGFLAGTPSGRIYKMMDIQQNVWDKTKEVIRQKVNDQTFAAWFEPIKQESFSEGTLTLRVPNKFFCNWVKDRYMNLLKEALGHVADGKIDVAFSLPAKEEVISSPAVTPGFERKTLPSTKALGFNPKYSFDDFIVGPSNRFAHAAALAICESPAKAYNPLFIYGGVGLGKTHLMHAIGQYIIKKHPKLKVLYISSENFTNQLIGAIQNRTTMKFRQLYRTVDILLIDDIHFIAGKESTQEEFFHTFNTLYDAHKQIVMSSDRSPKDIPTMEERLISRFEWGLITDVQSPDLETRIAILRKKVERETIVVPNDVTFLIAEKVKSNIRELEGALIRVVAYAKLVGAQINTSLVKEVLKDMFLEEDIRVGIDLIQKRVAEYFSIKMSDLKGRKRSKAVAYPRQIAMYLARELTDYSLPELGEFFGGRDHTTVLYACEKIQKELKNNKSVKDLINRLVGEVKA